MIRERTTSADLPAAAAALVEVHRTDGYPVVGHVAISKPQPEDAAAIRLYEQLGWQRVGITEHDTGHSSTIPAHCHVSPP